MTASSPRPAPAPPFVRNTAWGVLAQGIGTLAALATAVLLARWLPPASHGQVQAALALLAVLGFAAQPGVVAALIHRITASRQPVGRVLGTSLGLVTVSGTAAVGLLALAAAPVRDRLLVGLPPAAYAALLAAIVPQLYGLVLAGVARATDRFDASALATAAPGVGRALLLGALVAVAAPARPVLAVGAVVVAQGLATVAAAVAVLRATGWPAGPGLDEARAQVRFGTRTWLHTMAGQLHERVDVFLLAAVGQDAAQVAAYAVAVGVVTRLRVLPLAMSAALYPQVAAAPPSAGWAATARATRQGLLTTAGLALLVGLLVPWAVPWLFGAPYAASVAPAGVLLPAMVAHCVPMLAGRYFQAIDRQGVNVASQAVGVVVNVGLNLLLIPRLGAVGAAVATLVSYSVQAVWVGGAFLRARR